MAVTTSPTKARWASTGMRLRRGASSTLRRWATTRRTSGTVISLSRVSSGSMSAMHAPGSYSSMSAS